MHISMKYNTTLISVVDFLPLGLKNTIATSHQNGKTGKVAHPAHNHELCVLPLRHQLTDARYLPL